MTERNPGYWINIAEPSERFAREYCAKLAELFGDSYDVPQSDATEVVDSPSWYTSGSVETIAKIERVVDGLPAVQAYALGQVLRYFDRAGKKDATDTDLGKANNYAQHLVTRKWRDE